MRSFALLSFALLLGLPACGDDNKTPTSSDSDPTTNTPQTTTNNEDTTVGDNTTGPDTPTSTDPGTSTVDPGTTTVEETSTSTDSTTGDPPVGGDYGPCSNEDPENTGCPDGQLCIDPINTNNSIMGSFCSPQCSGPNNLCPTPMGVQGAQGVCAFGPAMGDPVQCGLVCNPDMDGCPAPMTCFDTGQMQQMQKIGFCVHEG